MCYMSFKNGRKSNKEYLANIIKQQHGSVLEHGTVTFYFEGISRSLSHEFIRHRHLSYSQLSQRFVEEQYSFVYPPAILGNAALERAFEAYCRGVMANHGDFIHRLLDETHAPKPTKAHKEAARSVLPNCTETKMIVTGNVRAWREFIQKRGSIHADAEIRRLACGILVELKTLCPNSVQDLELLSDGTVRTISVGPVD